MTEPNQLLICQSKDGSTRIDIMLDAESLWLNKKQLTEFFGKAKGAISEHIKHIFEAAEQYEVTHYNLDMVLALSFCAHIPVGVRFRHWAYFLGANHTYKALKSKLKAEINEEAWSTLNSDTSRAFDKPKSRRIAVKVINHLRDELMKVFKV